jgi:hypothetical protein
MANYLQILKRNSYHLKQVTLFNFDQNIFDKVISKNLYRTNVYRLLVLVILGKALNKLS